MSLDVSPDHLKIVQNILNKHVPDREVWAFGSRVTGKATETSDLDLTIIGETPLEFETLAALRDVFSESRIPYKVDVVDWVNISERFREIIRKDRIVIQKVINNGLGTKGFVRNWQELPFSHAVSVNPRTNLIRGKIYPFVDMATVSSDSHCVRTTEYRLFRGNGSKFAVGDTLMARITPCLENGKIARFCADHGVVGHGSTEFIVIRGREGFTENDYAYYLTKWDNVRNYAISQMTGTSGRQRVQTGSFDHLFVSIPPLPEQRAIAHILGTLDDKIELNRRMNETLEAMAQAIFKSWFVDFDPVRAKVEGRDTGLPKEISDLFPDGFEGSELGEIPRGWGVAPFTNVLEIVGGGTPKTSIENYWNGNIPWFSVEDSPNESDIWVVDTKRKITEEGFINSSTKILPIGAVIITARGTVGRIALVGVPMAMNQSCYGICGKFPANFWTYFSIKELIAGLKQNVHGSVFDTITRNTLERIFLVFPPNKILEVFETQVQSILNNIRLNLNESQNLSNIREILLPKLLSGDIRVDQPFGHIL